MSKVCSVSHLDIATVGLTKPEIVDGERVSFPYLECSDGRARKHMYIQLPISTIHEFQGNCLSVHPNDDDDNDDGTLKKLKDLERYFVKYLHDRSTTFFDGRQ